jgi:two-component system, OmpR family, response regulator VicR
MKVLIIDDDNFIRTVYKSALNQENIEVEVAADGDEGLAKAKQFKPDAILLDMILPKKDGFEVLKGLKSKKIPTIVFSSLHQQGDIDEALRLGAMKYLPKDQYSPGQIIDEIKKLG